MSSFWSIAIAALLVTCYLGSALGHGVLSYPRPRGALRTQRNLNPKEMVADAPIDYCPHCQNAGGVGMVKQGGPWLKYEPMKYSRGGFGICGDPTGQNDHMKSGRFANPPSMPYVAVFEPGSVVNFEYDITASHNGYLEFYLCDVSKMPGQDISFEGFSEHCYYLERVPHESCESGYDKDCGPIDPKWPGRWVLPCRYRAGDQGDQIVGGSTGKMAYRLPDVEMEMAVVQNYWLTQNSCIDPDGFMENYNYPKAWAGCPGDGGSVGGKPSHESCSSPGKFPEEFWNCADVQVLRGGKSSSKAGKKPAASDKKHEPDSSRKRDENYGHKEYHSSEQQAHDPSNNDYEANDGGHSGEYEQEDNDYMASYGASHCVGTGSSCQLGLSVCCNGGICESKDGSGPKCS